MVDTSTRVVARYLRALRPIAIDKKAIGHFVQHFLVPGVVAWLKRHPHQNEPLGAAQGITRERFDVEAADGRGVVTVDVVVNARPAKGKWAAVLGGSFSRGSKTINLDINGALSPAEYLYDGSSTGLSPIEALGKTNRLQPLWSCTHESCLPYGLYSNLIHEATHAAESVFPAAPVTYYQYGPEGEIQDLDMLKYLADKGEVRAFMQQIVDETLQHAAKLREHAGSNKRLVDLVLKLSTTWKIVEPYLSTGNRVKILQAVYGALDAEGVLF